jgi:hypothetical protein
MSMLNEIEIFARQRVWNDHTFPEQDTSLFNREELWAFVELFDFRPVGVLAENFDVWPADLNEFLHSF